MKLPRSVSGKDLAKRLKKLGYQTTRQHGSHIRLTTKRQGEHHITIPNHDPIKIGTLSAILNEVALHHKKTKTEIINAIF